MIVTAAAVFLPGPASPLPDVLVVALLAIAASIVIAAAVALLVVVVELWEARHPRTGPDPRLPAPEAPRGTVGPTGELIDLDEPRHRLMELR